MNLHIASKEKQIIKVHIEIQHGNNADYAQTLHCPLDICMVPHYKEKESEETYYQFLTKPMAHQSFNTAAAEPVATCCDLYWVTKNTSTGATNQCL